MQWSRALEARENRWNGNLLEIYGTERHEAGCKNHHRKECDE
jgi:hypothetical protein